MSKLPKAPLLEVIFEVIWAVKTKQDLTKCEYLHGDLFARLSNTYPYREMLIPHEIPIEACVNTPAHRFRVGKDAYPLVQVGPGILTVNSNDDMYVWENYEKWCIDAYKNLSEIYNFTNTDQINFSLKYFDFFPFNFKDNDVNKYLSDFFHIELNQTFLNETGTPSSVNVGFFYDIELGKISIRIIKGINSKKQTGIIIDTSLSTKLNDPDIDIFSKWLNDAHDYVSKSFKTMTKGKMYDSFKI
jgi:uncharacterized protein (TIGR04255 family)